MARKPANPQWSKTGGNGWEGDIDADLIPDDPAEREIYDTCHAPLPPEEREARDMLIAAHRLRVEAEEKRQRESREELPKAPDTNIKKLRTLNRPWRLMPDLPIFGCAGCGVDLISIATHAAYNEDRSCRRMTMPGVATMIDQGDGHMRPWCEACVLYLGWLMDKRKRG